MDTTTLRTYGTALIYRGGLLLLGGIIVLILILNAPQVIGADHSYVVLSDSMDPTYSAGDVIIVKSVAPAMIKEGDVITFQRSENHLVTHRVVDIEQREQELYFKTKGDANEESDLSLVPASQVIGRVWFNIPYIGYALWFARSKAGIALLVITPAVLLILTEAWELV